ncbi:nuclear transport factor 2 family protein [Echinicola marina]|uniref:nuclear transport factor 2 family protein n=1 Tax=Echinicola marina TaxID=2859768 RepID=UPI001CF67767|nr:nuclear transport factor 2 family protein [Echinicola marina]UCS95308.1 nuclear transport factor 2 family protein [Echinicola marina]
MNSAVNRLIFTLLMLAGFSFGLKAQEKEVSDETQIRSVIASLFEGMHERDEGLLKGAFAEEAVLQTIKQGPDGTSVETSRPREFVNELATVPAEMVLEEKILSMEIRQDGAMASVWAPYAFYINGDLSHCGVNSFQLVKKQEGWKVVYIIDTRRKKGC